MCLSTVTGKFAFRWIVLSCNIAFRRALGSMIWLCDGSDPTSSVGRFCGVLCDCNRCIFLEELAILSKG